MQKQTAVILAAFAALLLGTLWLASSPVLAQGGTPGGVLPSAPSGVPFIIDLYERTVNAPAQGTPTETGPMVTLPSSVNPGYVVILECGDPAITANQSNVANWSDVLVFPNVTARGPSAPSLASTVQLLSKGATFPSYATVTSNPHVFILETQVGTGMDDLDVTVYGAGNQYLVHSAAANGACTPAPPQAPAQVPEGDTLALVGAGLIGLAGYAGLRWRARRA